MFRIGRRTLEPLFPPRTVSTSSKQYHCNLPNTEINSKLGPRLKVVALVDPSIERARAVLQQKCDSFVVSAYKDTRVFKTFEDFIKNMPATDRPRAVIIGSPPMFRGSTQPGRDIELQILEHLPGAAIFVEKPIATGIDSEINDVFEVSRRVEEAQTICSVG